MKSLFDTLNIVHGEEEKRGFFKLNAISLGFTVGGVLSSSPPSARSWSSRSCCNISGFPTPATCCCGSAAGQRCTSC